MLTAEYKNHLGEEHWLERRLVQQNSVENAHFLNAGKRDEVIERNQISWKSSQTGIYKRDVDSLVKNIYAQDFDKGYWVQTELEILTLPLPQKKEIRKFREQN